MTPERWIEIKDIFALAVEQAPEKRMAAVEELCHGDQELQSHVLELLSQHDEMGQFLEGAQPQAPKSLIQPQELLAGRYRIVELLGTGGMGEVYEAEDIELGERIAVKVIRQETSFGPGVVERLRREVQLARKVTHPNVCRVFDLGHDRRQQTEIIFLTMELLKGETLFARLKREGKIAPPEALVIALQLCRALDAAHQAGVLHRDFKCSNVMLLGSGEQLRAVVTDFGIARWMHTGDDSHNPVTSQGMVLGTPAYMSPEQLLGEQLTPASDIYSLGLVLYEMVTGSRPFRDQSSWTETLKRLTAVPPPPAKVVPELGERWNSTILRCLERDISRRFASASDVAEALTGKRTFAGSRISRRMLAAAACALLVLATVAFAFRGRLWPPALPPEKHLAVLPFSFKGADAASKATAYGLSQSLTGSLARLQSSEHSLWVVPWKEIRTKTQDDAAQAASAFGVNLVMTGELQNDSGKLRLLTKLKEASTLKDLRTEVIEIPEAAVVTLEDTLLERTSAMLQIKLPPEILHHLGIDETTQPGAYEFYEQGRGYLLHLTQEDFDRAITLFQRATEKDPNFTLAYANLAYAYSLKFRETHDLVARDQARKFCDKAISMNDKVAPAHLALGVIAQENGDLDSAIREFEQALQLDPSDDETVNLLSVAYDKAGRLLQAEALLKDAVKRAPGSWFNYSYLAVFYLRHAQYGPAETYFRTAADLAPDNPRVLYNLGGVYMYEGKYKEAEDVLLKAIAIKPSAGAYSNLGQARIYQGRYADAAIMLQKAAELRPSDDRLWCNLGTAYVLAGNQPKAEEAFKKSIQLAEKIVSMRPKDTQALGQLALYQAKLGEKAKAEETLARALRSSDNDPELLFNSVLVYELTGQRDRALAALRSAVQAGFSVSEIQNAPELASLRTDKRYGTIVTRPQT